MIARQEDDMRVTREAAHWLMELETEGDKCHAEFAQWLRRSPEHVEEFLAISGMSQRLDGVDPQRHIDVHALLTQGDADVVQLLTPARRFPPALAHKQSRWPLALAATVLLMCAVLAAQWFWFPASTYVTGTGEQRTFQLADGSLIYLNTQSQAKVRFSNAARKVELLAGEALFEVQRDAERPFTVVSGNAQVRVLGTAFNINRSRPEVTAVSVVEGAVQVSVTDAGDEAPLRVTAGEQANVRADGLTKQSLPDLSSVTAWRERRLVFRDRPLAEVAAEFNRYNTVQFDIRKGAGQEPLSGVFAADRPELFVAFLRKDGSIEIERSGDRWIIRPRL